MEEKERQEVRGVEEDARRASLDRDARELARLGYRQVFERGMGAFSNFAISFTIISILAGCLTSYFIAFSSGGPVAITWGWLLVGVMVTFVGIALGEIASSMPTAGSMYFWAAKLGGPVWGWFTGWINLIGVIAVTSAIDMGAAIFWNYLLNIWFGLSISHGTTFTIFTVIVVLHLLINLNKVWILGMLNSISAVWHMVGVVVIVAALIFVPEYHQPASFVFGGTINATGFPGKDFSDPWFWFVFALGLLMAQYTITGFDASAHLAEETRHAARSAAIGIVSSIVLSVIFGFILLVAVTFAVPANIQGVLDAGGNALPYIWEQALGSRWAGFLLFIACVAQFFCGNAALASASRMLFAFSRDGAVPGKRLWRKIWQRNHVPGNAVIFCAVFAWALMIPTLANGAIGYAVGTSVAVIGLYVSFAIPIFLRWRMGERFECGPWNTGGHYRWICPLSFCWIGFISILFMLPTSKAGVWFSQEFSWTSANYTPLTFGGVLLAIGCWWLLSARKWYTGPVREVGEEDLVLLERGELTSTPDEES
ncbi:MAG: amino acid permease [Rubrobacter sp.]|nr:amino acid permease [Rubrobacter sp.]